MRKRMVMTAAVVLSAGVAGAQKITFSNTNDYFTLRICNLVQAGLQCDLTYMPTEDGKLEFSAKGFHVVTADGTQVQASQVRAAGGSWTAPYLANPTVLGYAGVSFQVSVLFNVPKATRSLAVFSAYGSTLRNVAIGSAAAAAPTPSSPVINLPTTQAFIGGKAFTVTFTNCKLNSAGAYVCTSTVTPSR